MAENSDNDFALASVLVELNLVTPDQVRECLSAKAEMARRGPSVPGLRELLLQKGYITPDVYARVQKMHAGGEEKPIPPEAQAALKVPGNKLGRFILVEKIGKGSFGGVYKAWEREPGRWVAVKFVRWLDAEEKRRTLREAQAVSRLKHPNVLTVYGLGEDKGQEFFVMPFVDGITIDKANLSLKGKLEAIRDAAFALDVAHQKNLVHRNLKPANLMMGVATGDTERRVYILDFGIVPHPPGGIIVGTPAFMSPEQARGLDPVDPRCDTYSLGATLYTLVTGHPPFHDEDVMSLVDRVQREEPPPPRSLDPDIPREVELIVLKAMNKDPARRYQSISNMGRDIQKYLDWRATSTRISPAVKKPEAPSPSGAFEILELPPSQASVTAGAPDSGNPPVEAPERSRTSRLRAAATGPAEPDQVTSAAAAENGPGQVQVLDREARSPKETSAGPGVAKPTRPVEKVEESAPPVPPMIVIQTAPPPPSSPEIRIPLRKEYFLAAAGILGALLVLGFLVFVFPDWIRRKPAQGSGVAAATTTCRPVTTPPTQPTDMPPSENPLKELAARWESFVEAKQGLHRREADPAETRGKMERAAAALAEFAQAKPDLPAGHYLVARARWLLDDPEGARTALQASLDRDARFGPALALLGRIKLEEHLRLAALGKTEEAEKRLEEAQESLGNAADAGEKISLRGTGMPDLSEEGAAETLARALIQYYVLKDKTESWSRLEAAADKLASEEYYFWLAAWSSDPAQKRRWLDKSLQHRPHFARGYFFRGAAWLGENKFKEAAQDFSQALLLHPGFSEAFELRCRARVSAADYAALIPEAAEWMRRNPAAPSPYLYRGLALAMTGKAEEAEADLSEAIRKDGTLADAWYYRGFARSKKNDLKGAIEDYTEVLKLDRGRTEALLFRGLARAQAGDAAGAEADLTEALQARPNYKEAVYYLAVAREQSGRWKEAVEAWTRYAELEPEQPDVYYRRALARLRAGDPRGAEEDLNVLIARKPGVAEAHWQRALLREARKDLAGVVEDCNVILQAAPQNTDALLKRGLALQCLSRPAEALKDFEAALAAKPGAPEILFRRGQAKDVLNDLAGALADYTAAIQAQPGYVEALLSRADVLLKLQKLPEAESDYQAVLAKDPRALRAYRGLGEIKLRQGDFNGAVQQYTMALGVDPRCVECYIQRALIRGGYQNDFAGAIEDCNAAIGIDPQSADAYARRGITKLTMGGNEREEAKKVSLFREAEADLTQAIRLNPKNDEAYTYRALTRLNLQDNPGTVNDANEAIRLNGRSADAFFARAMGYWFMASQGATNARQLLEWAENDLTTALQVGPPNWGYRDWARQSLAEIQKARSRRK